MEVLIALVLIAAVAYFVSVPLRSPARREPDAGEEAVRDDLEARKQSKYREIRDTELDHAQGKINDADFERQNAELRAEAVEILKRIDEEAAAAGRRAADEREAETVPEAGEAGSREPEADTRAERDPLDG